MEFYYLEGCEYVREQCQQDPCPKLQLAETQLAAGRLAYSCEFCTGLQQTTIVMA